MMTPETPLEAVTFAVVDVETTGLYPAAGDRVCEVAVLRGQGGQVLDTWSTLIHPGRSIPADAQRVNHISDAMVREALPFVAIAPDLLDRLRDTVLVAHNAPFDMGFLTNELRLGGISPKALPALVVDTCALARARYHYPSNSLGYLGKALGVRDTNPAHRALADVTTTWRVLDWFLADLRRQGHTLDTLADLLKLQVVGVPGWRGRRLFPVRNPAPPRSPARSAPRAVAAGESTTTLIARAIAAGHTLQTRYIAADGTVSERRIAPRRVTLELGTLCVVAYCYLREEERTFRLDRMEILAVEEVSG